MAPRTLVQVRLRSGSTELTCWTDAVCKQGDIITLRDSDEPERAWLVTWTGSILIAPVHLHRIRNWPVGGL